MVREVGTAGTVGGVLRGGEDETLPVAVIVEPDEIAAETAVTARAHGSTHLMSDRTAESVTEYL